jgi:hypothetical protein
MTLEGASAVLVIRVVYVGSLPSGGFVQAVR